MHEGASRRLGKGGQGMGRKRILLFAVVLSLLSALHAPLSADDSVTVIVRLRRSAGRDAAEGIRLRPKSSDTAPATEEGPSSLRGLLASRRRFFYDEHRKIMGLLFDSRLETPASSDPFRLIADPVKSFFGRPTDLGAIEDFKALWLVDAVRVRCSRAVADRLRKHGDVSAVDIDPFLEVGSPAPGEGSTTRRPWHGRATGAEACWAEGLDGEGVRVGVIDTGLDMNVPFAAHVDAYRDFTSRPTDDAIDPVGHGTAVTSLICGPDGVGVAPAARLVVARAVEVLHMAGDRDERQKIMGAFASRMIESMQWMIDPDGNETTDDGPDILNCSWGFPRNVDLDEDIFREAVDRIRKAGILPVFSAGNARSASANRVNFPGIYQEVLTVGATTEEGDRADFSCVGYEDNPHIKPDLVAPGQDVVCIAPGGERVLQRGTSFSAPIVAGGLALLRQARGDLDSDGLGSLLVRSAEDRGLPGKDRAYGHGYIRLAEALRLLEKETEQLVDQGQAEGLRRWVEGGGLRSGSRDLPFRARSITRFYDGLLARLRRMGKEGAGESMIRSFLDRALPRNEEGIAIRRRLRQQAAFAASGDPSQEAVTRAIASSFRP